MILCRETKSSPRHEARIFASQKQGGLYTYSIGQVSAMTNLPISSLRYYDKEGFFPNLEKQSGIRRFSKAELDSIRMNSKYKAKNASHYFS
ncbi:MAG: MerR family DNA-binding transcriptional regulator [Waltera sp.]|uniref:MerR family DNA-binding transcriptional regulator n=1 Tax=Waltera sp. TaxID=2815806 RepID=UPI00399A4227